MPRKAAKRSGYPLQSFFPSHSPTLKKVFLLLSLTRNLVFSSNFFVFKRKSVRKASCFIRIASLSVRMASFFIRIQSCSIRILSCSTVFESCSFSFESRSFGIESRPVSSHPVRSFSHPVPSVSHPVKSENHCHLSGSNGFLRVLHYCYPQRL